MLFAFNNICSLWCLDWGVNIDVDGRERVGIHHDFTLYYLLNGIRGAKRLPTIFAPHVWLLRGKFEVTPPSIPPSPLPESVSCGFCCQACTSLLRKDVVFLGLLHTHLFYYKTVFIMAIDMAGKWYINADIYIRIRLCWNAI